MDDSIYEIENGLRLVRPYEHKFTAYTKARWLSMSIIDVFSREFKAYSKDYYLTAVKNGKITVNGKIIAPEYLLKNSDKIEHTTERRETPVVAELP